MAPIALLGGTFDPVHNGHLRTALEVGELCGCDAVRLLPNRSPPHRHTPQASAKDRLAMLQRACEGVAGVQVDDQELQRPGPSYMVDTLSALRLEFGPQRPIILILGVDALLGLKGWQRWQEIPELAHLLVVERPGWERQQLAKAGLESLIAERQIHQPQQLSEHPAGGVLFHPVTPLAISSSAIREMIRAGRSVRFLLPEGVWRYIEQQRLYQITESTPRSMNGD